MVETEDILHAHEIALSLGQVVVAVIGDHQRLEAELSGHMGGEITILAAAHGQYAVVVAPYYVFRGLVIASPEWYPSHPPRSSGWQTS